MTTEQIDCIQETFYRIYPDSYDRLAELFYTRLFELDPALRSLFPADMHNQRLKLMTTFNIIVNGLRHPATILPFLHKLGHLHVDHAVQPNHYTTANLALIWALQQCLGADWTPETAEAWQAAYTLIAAPCRPRPPTETQDVHAGCASQIAPAPASQLSKGVVSCLRSHGLETAPAER